MKTLLDLHGKASPFFNFKKQKEKHRGKDDKNRNGANNLRKAAEAALQISFETLSKQA